MPTAIEWCHETWNPIWGCLHNCSFCYARKFARRFYDNVARSNKLTKKEAEKLKNFEPVFLLRNYGRKFRKKDRIIFVNSMSDPAFWEKVWIEKIFERIKHENNKYFLFLTKAPESYKNFPKKIPENVWLGISATGNSDLVARTEILTSSVSTGNLFVSLEPLLHPIKNSYLTSLQNYRWVIVGALTGKQYHPLYKLSNSWIEPIERFCKKNRIPLFIKDNAEKFGVRLVQEFPECLERSEE